MSAGLPSGCNTSALSMNAVLSGPTPVRITVGPVRRKSCCIEFDSLCFHKANGGKSGTGRVTAVGSVTTVSTAAFPLLVVSLGTERVTMTGRSAVGSATSVSPGLRCVIGCIK